MYDDFWDKDEEALEILREWRQYVTKGIDGKPDKPDDIPNTPNMAYSEFKGYGDWLGSNKKPTKKSIVHDFSDPDLDHYPNFAEARRAVRKLKFIL